MRGVLRVFTVVVLVLSALTLAPAVAAVTDADPAHTTITAAVSPQSVDVLAGVQIMVQAKNAAGVAETEGGDTVTLDADHGTLSAVTDNGDGTYTATLTDTVVRTDTVSGTINGSPIATGDATVQFTAGVATTITIEDKDDGTGAPVVDKAITAGQHLNMYAVGRDQFGNFVDIENATWSLGSITGGVLSTDLAPTTGTVSSMTGRLVGTAVAEADWNGHLDTTGTLTVEAGAPAQLVVETAANGSGIRVNEQDLPADLSLTVYAVERDGSGNYLDNIAATWSLTGKLDGVVDSDLVAASDDKSAVFTGHKLGSAVIEATAFALAPVSSGIITVTHGDATTISVETADDGSGHVLTAQDVIAGSSVTGYAIARDAEDNFAGNISATWSLVAPTDGVDAGTDLAGSSSATLGTSATFTGHVAGTASLRATFSTLTPVDSGLLSVKAGAATDVRVETAADGSGGIVPLQDVPAGSTITVYAVSRDAYGNYVGNVPATWSLVGPAGGVTGTDLVPSLFGTSAEFTGHLVGSTKIEADSGLLIATLSGVISVVAGTATQIRIETSALGNGSVVGTQNLATGNALTVYAIERDTYGNFVANVAVTWSLTNKSGGVVDGDLVAAGDNMSATLTGAAAGTATIHAEGTFSADSGTITVTVVRVPDPPTGVSATSGDRGASTVSWTAPLSDGGDPITGYTVTGVPTLAGTPIVGCSTTGAILASCRVSGLDAVEYTFTVHASNSQGDSVESTQATGTPVTPDVPGKPTSVAGVGFDGSATVTWTAPADDGGRDIQSYSVKTYRFTLPSTTTWVKDTLCTTDPTCSITGLTNGTAYKFTVVATNTIGTSAESDLTAMVTPHVGATYVPLTPNRILDTRDPSSQLTGPFQQRIGRTVQVTNQFPLDSTRNVPSNATAVTAEVSVINPTGYGYVSVLTYAINGQASTSSVNFAIHDSVSAGVTVLLATDSLKAPLGSIGILYSAQDGTQADITFDITGYFVTGTSASRYLPRTPNRVLDSRGTVGGMSGGLHPGVNRGFKVTDFTTDWNKKVPSNAVAVVGTLTVVNERYAGYLTISSDPLDSPPTASLYFANVPSDPRATTLTLKIGAGGMLYVTYTATAAGVPPTARVDAIFDVLGYFQAGTAGYMYVPVPTTRILDSRVPLGLSRLAARYAYTFPVTGRAGVPSNAFAVTGTLTVTRQNYASYFSLTNSYGNIKPVLLGSQPSTSTLNFQRSDRATGVTLPLNASLGRLGICYWAPLGYSAAAIFDVSGYFV